MEHEFFIIRFSHKGRNGYFTPQENVVHVHGNGYHNTRCKLVGNQFYCPICNEYFEQQIVYASAKERGVGKDRSHWIETKVIGQHMEKVIYSHDHADKGVKAAEITSTNLFATCLACQGTLDLFSWRETNTKNKQQPFAAVFVEQEKMSIWAEISEFRAENIDIWLEDKKGQAFFLSTEGKLLPAEKEDEMVFCGGKTWKDNDTRKSLLFLVDEVLTQELINRQILKEEDDGFNLVMPEEKAPEPAMEDSPEISQKPELRPGRITRELTTGDMVTAHTPETEAEDDTGLIPRATEADLLSSTPIPESNLPLLEMADEPIITINHQETVLSGSSETKAEEMNEEEAEAPKIVQIMPLPEELLTGVKPLTDTLNEETGEAESYDPLMAEAELDLDMAEAKLAESLEKTKTLLDGNPTTDVIEATDPDPATDVIEAVDPTPTTDPAPVTPTPAQAESNDDDDGEDEDEDEDEDQLVTTRNCVVCGKILAISKLTGKGLCPDHEKRCAICDTVTPKEALFCGGCGSRFKQEPQEKFWNQVLLGMGGIAVIILLAGLFAGMLHQFQARELQKKLENVQQENERLNKKIGDKNQAMDTLDQRQNQVAEQLSLTELKMETLWLWFNELSKKLAEQKENLESLQVASKKTLSKDQKAQEETPVPLESLEKEPEPLMVALSFSKELITITIRGLERLQQLKTAKTRPQKIPLKAEGSKNTTAKNQGTSSGQAPKLAPKTPPSKPEEQGLRVYIWRGPS